MSTEVSVPDIAPFLESLKNVRADSNPTNWSLIGHVNGNPNAIEFRNSGTGGLSELESHFKDDEMMYALVRLEETIDLSMTIKFVYIIWNGSQVSFIKRGKYGVVSGSVEKHFSPYHCSITASAKADVTEETVMKSLSEASGTRSKVMETSEAATRKDRGFTSSSNIVPTGKQMTGLQTPKAVDVKIDDSVFDAIADVRTDASATDWCVAEYQGNIARNPIVLRSKGSDSFDGMKACLEEDKAAYMLLRLTDVVDEISTVKFVFIQWVGTSVKPMMKGKISTHKSTVEKVFAPFHVTVYATSEDEISFNSLMDKVANASGSKSHVQSTATIG